MFESRLIDRFSRTHFSIVPIIYVPVVTAMLVYSVRSVGLTPSSTAGLFVLGAITWTLTEYWLHRTFFHWKPNASWGHRLHFLVHGVHHDWPRDRFRLVMPPAASIAVYLAFLSLFAILWKSRVWAFHAGFTAGYMAYDLLHYAIHHGNLKSPWMKALRRHHLIHHSPRRGRACKFGVSSTLWDHVFGTYSEH